jgi:hypothetical protein
MEQHAGPVGCLSVSGDEAQSYCSIILKDRNRTARQAQQLGGFTVQCNPWYRLAAGHWNG